MTNLYPYPNTEPGKVEPTPDGFLDRQQRRWDRIGTAQVTCTVINVLSGLFAVVLVAHIVLVIGGANPANDVASFVRGFAAAVSLGFDGLFTPANAKVQVLLNNGAAAVVWLALGAVMTALIRRFALPGPRGLTR
jgi:hypothetical protein